ncbi:MAG: chorismate synthase [Flavobacteriales bacterium]|nr:chorismate synthase [Flavobacteriales bacterium]
MPGNSFGKIFRLTSFGASHDPWIGGVIDGCPAALRLDREAIQVEMDRRRPGGNPLGTARNEADRVELISGVLDGTTLGTPIALLIANKDARPQDYDHLKDTFRPGHADRSWEQKYGVRDHRGGGRSSARETAVRVAAGAIARQLIATAGMRVNAFVTQVGEARLEAAYDTLDLSATWNEPVRCPDAATAKRMTEAIETVRAEGDTVGGIITCVVSGMPPGLGEPVFDKLHADLARAMLGINAAKGFQLGEGFAAAAMRGSAYNDALIADDTGAVTTSTNHSGGIQGGISNGENIVFDVAFRPVSTLMKEQRTVDREGRSVVLEGKGRHDPCVVPRAVPIVEAMTCLVLADHWLRQRTARL